MVESLTYKFRRIVTRNIRMNVTISTDWLLEIKLKFCVISMKWKITDINLVLRDRVEMIERAFCSEDLSNNLLIQRKEAVEKEERRFAANAITFWNK